MSFEQGRNRLTTHFSGRIPVVKRHMTVHIRICEYTTYIIGIL